eukprot:scaffold324270_cov38-Prasinocladus_malaysianus.AAC.1
MRRVQLLIIVPQLKQPMARACSHLALHLRICSTEWMQASKKSGVQASSNYMADTSHGNPLNTMPE